MSEPRTGGPPDLSDILAALVAAAPTVRDLVDAYIAATVEACDGDKRAAAGRLGITHKTVYNRLDAISDLCKNYNN